MNAKHHLSDAWHALLVLAFGASTSALILFFAGTGARAADLLLLGASAGALVTAAVWLWILAARRSRAWGLAFTAAILVPYVNFVVASVYARRYWSEGGRAPALLALAGMLGQTFVSMRILFGSVIPPV